MKKSIILIGGGHGLSNIVKGFKNEDVDLNIIVSSTDDGGHTGRIREEFNYVAVGDLRMVINELIEDNSILQDIFNYRFSCLHGIKNVSLGNLIIASLLEKYSDIDKVICYFKERCNIEANIFLSTNNSLILIAQCDDGQLVKYERMIGICNKKIERLFVDKEVICNEEMLNKIENANVIVLCPGSLYTSVGSVLCIDKIKEAIKRSAAEIVYVCNIMTQDGETQGYSVSDHVEALEKIMNKQINRVIVNDGIINEEILGRYKSENSEIVKCEEKKSNYEFYNLIEIKDNKVRHDSQKTKKIILDQQ